MLHIKKGEPPASLVAFEHRIGASYDSVDFPRSDVYESLLKEQGGLCAYCMRRITKENIHIEHWVPQNGEEYVDENNQADCDRLAIKYTQEDCDRLAISYNNMFGVCSGGRGNSHEHTTCDTHRRNCIIYIDPKKKWMIDTIQYSMDGRIFSTNDDINKDICKTLNLNELSLTENRKRALKACIDTMTRHKGKGTWTNAMINKQIKHYESLDENGNRIEYAGIVLDWLKRHKHRT